MKPKTPLRSFLFLAGSSLLAASSLHAATVYWDNDGATPGFGTAAGTWAAPTTGDATQGWSQDTNGATEPISFTTTSDDALNFGNGATGLAAGTITVSGIVDAGNMTFASGSGAIVLTGGTINLAAAQTTTVNNATNTISSILTGAATSFTKAGTGTLILSGENSYAGATVVNAGTLQLARQVSLYNNTPASWTAANINVISAATLALNVDSVGTAGFASASLDTLLTNISVANSATEGLQAGAILGFDTSTATGGTFTQGNAIADSTGGSGGAISVTKLGIGTLVFDKANSYAGTTTVKAGVLRLDNAAALPSGALIFQTGGIVGLGAGDFARTVSATPGSNQMRFVGGGGFAAYGAPRTVNLGTTVTWNTGGFIPTGSYLFLAAADADNTITFSSNIATNNVARTVSVANGSASIDAIISGAITNSGTNANGGLTKDFGEGTLALTALNTWGGTTTISQGTLMLGDGTGNSGGIGNRSTSVVISSGATLAINRTGQTAQGGTTALGNNANISGGGSIRMLGGDTGTGVLILTRANTFTGGVTLDAGTLRIGGASIAGTSGPLGNGGTLTLNGGTIDTSNTTDQALANVNPIVVAGSFAFGGTANLTLPGAVTMDGTRTITLNGSKTLTLAGNVTDGASVGALTKAGTGTLRLSGTNTYTGATTVSEGTLELVGGSQASPVTVSSGATLGFTLGSPTTSTSTVTFDGATPKVTVTGPPAAATLMTASSITGTPVLDPAISGYVLAIEDGGTTLKLNAVASESYDTWATANGVTGGETGDSDDDGVKNLVEYALVDGGERGVLSGNTITFTKRGTPYGSDLTYEIEGSTSLGDGSWTSLAKPPVVETAGEISYIFTPGAPEKFFVRLKVTRL